LIGDGIQYERIDGREWEMLLFEREEINSYLSRLIDVKRSIYTVMNSTSIRKNDSPSPSDVREDVSLFFKLPPWFKIKNSHERIQSRPNEILHNSDLLDRTNLIQVHRRRHPSGEVHSHPHIHRGEHCLCL